MQEPIDWRQLREFTDIDLDESYVLSWSCGQADLVLDVDLCLGFDHPFYEKPRPAEKGCYRAAHIIFPEYSMVAFIGDEDESEIVEDLESLPSGKISGLTRDDIGRYELHGKFGSLRIASKRLMVRLVKDFS